MDHCARRGRAYRDYCVTNFKYLRDQRGRKIGSNFLSTEIEFLYRAVAFFNWRFAEVLNCRIAICHGISDPEEHERGASALTKLLSELAKWGRRHGFKLHYVYVHEVGSKHGLHTHILTHVPVRLRKQLETWCFRAYERLWGRQFEKSLVDIKLEDRKNQQSALFSQWEHFCYMCKGVHPDWATSVSQDGRVMDCQEQRKFYDLLRIPGKYRHMQGFVGCRRRFGISRELASASFKVYDQEYCFRSQLDLGRYNDAREGEEFGGFFSFQPREELRLELERLRL